MFRTALRRFSSHAASDVPKFPKRQIEKLPPKLLANYKLFQTNMEEPVYLKGGTKDKIFFGLTCLILGISSEETLRLMYEYRNYK